MKYYTDGWGTYERHIDAEQHKVGKANRKKSRVNTLTFVPESNG
jgi:IS1 family transposase